MAEIIPFIPRTKGERWFIYEPRRENGRIVVHKRVEAVQEVQLELHLDVAQIFQFPFKAAE